MSIPPPELIKTADRRVACDGATAIRGPIDGSARFRPAALGHPKVYLEIDESGYVDCGYCDRRFVLEGGPADGADHSALSDISASAGPDLNSSPAGND